MHHRGWYFTCPSVFAFRARVTGFPVSVHDRLQYGCERRDAYTRGYHHCMLGSEYVTGRCAVRADQINLNIQSPYSILYKAKQGQSGLNLLRVVCRRDNLWATDCYYPRLIFPSICFHWLQTPCCQY